MIPDISSPFFTLAAALFGALVGSFLNVCIVRLPRGESIVWPRSHCPQCREPLAPWENIPLVSFLVLRGRCRHCGRSISWQYPIVELMTIALAVVSWWWFHDPIRALFYFSLFLAPLLVISAIDLKHMIIPDAISLPGIGVGLISRMAFAPHGFFVVSLADGVLGALIGGGLLYVIARSYEKLKGYEGLGGGDVKLMAMLGAFFGWRAVILMLLISSVLGVIVGIICMIAFRKGLKYALPFGPFLAFAGAVQLFFGDRMITWYVGLFH